MEVSLTQYRLIHLKNLFEGYGNGVITVSELDYMLDILFGEL